MGEGIICSYDQEEGFKLTVQTSVVSKEQHLNLETLSDCLIGIGKLIQASLADADRAEETQQDIREAS